MQDKPPRLTVLARRLLSAVRDIGKALQDQNKAIGEANETAKEQGRVNPEVRAEVSLPHGVETRKSATDATDDKKYQNWNLLVSSLTLIGVMAYAGLAFSQWREMINATDATEDAVHEARFSRQQAQRSLDATIDQFHLDQRAWVSILSVQLDKPYSINNPGDVVVELANTGKTPALNAAITGGNFSFLPNFGLEPLKEIKRMVIAPNSNTDEMFLPIPPMNATTKIYVRFKIEYRDVFQKPTDEPHSTTFCGYYPSTKPPFFFNCDGGGTMN